MDRKGEEASGVRRKSVVILSDRSREIIRLFEERQRKRRQAEDRPQAEEQAQPGKTDGSPPAGAKSHALSRMPLGDKPLVLVAIGFTIGFGVMGIAELIQSTASKKPAVISAAQEPVRIVGPAFVPNVNPREH